jgi:predicted RNA-binding Zn-ribbon protein involved in translation (DUF1610 family)
VRVECESCRELVAASLAVEAGAVHARCPACGHVTVAALAVPSSDAPACPKCGATRGVDSAACPGCGLAADRMAAYREAAEAAVAEPVRAAWTRATEAWTEQARHDELMRQAAAHDGYAWAAGRYRTRIGDPVAARQLDRLRRAAEATLLASATVRPEAGRTPYRGPVGVLAVLIFLLVVGVVGATMLRGSGARSAVPVDSVGPAGPAGRGAPVRPLTPGHPVSSSTIR